MHQRIGTVALGVTSLLVAGSAAGLAATKASASASGKTYKACLTKHHKLTHVTTGPAPTCTAAGSHLVIWNQRGPRGADGRPGQNGEDGTRGPQGPAGPAGLTDVITLSSGGETFDLDGSDVDIDGPDCPSGTEAISGWGTVNDISVDTVNRGASPDVSEGGGRYTWISSSGPDADTPDLPDSWEVDWGTEDTGDGSATFTVYEVCADVSQQVTAFGTR
jgi:hypothetical protein